MKKQDIKTIQEMLRQGKNAGEISLVLDIPSSTIRAHIRRHPEFYGGKPCRNCGKTPDATSRPEGKAFLLRSVPHGMVEQPPGAGSEESILHHCLRPLRKGV